MTLAPMMKAKRLNITDTTDPDYKKGVHDKTNVLLNREENGMPFYFKDLRNNEYVFFRAYLEGVSENVAPSWAETNYMGRSEPVYVYERSTRDITLKLFAQTSAELEIIYAKIKKLTGMCYPQYQIDKKLSQDFSTQSTAEQKTRMKPPLVKFRMGDLYGGTDKEQLGFIRSLSYVVPEESTWETELGKRVPKFITATIQFQVIHNFTPNANTQFYGYGGGHK